MSVFSILLFPFLLGCLQFKQTLKQESGKQQQILNFSQEKYCFEFNSEQINGKQIEHNVDRYQFAIEKRYYSYRQSIEGGLIEKVGIKKCEIGSLSRSKIKISFNWNTDPDCVRRQSPEEFKGCQIWNFLAGSTLGIIPFWGSTTSEISFRIYESNLEKAQYIYKPSVYIVFSILLLPVTWVNLIRSVPEDTFEQTIELFLADSGLSQK
ncbi:hypothetical protein DLM75_23605 [Leptospira stimsonii]|uniref:Uncharacterized protein n=1 Tax=Leptospira stimsonii TaxID=2202203 RepID=A0A396YRF6_9LEPT|nr:hypothetical protein DLM75_23605 [Leptospira stimsonii]